MLFFANNKLVLFVAALLLISASAVSADCTRFKYYGSPINFIHKAHEQIHALLQYANVDTQAFFLGSAKTFDLPTNTVWEDYLFYITNTAGSIKKLIPIRISSKNLNLFVDEYAMLDITPTPAPNYDHILKTRFKFGSILPLNLTNYLTAFECRLIKEEFTYFYEMYPSRFAKNVK